MYLEVKITFGLRRTGDTAEQLAGQLLQLYNNRRLQERRMHMPIQMSVRRVRKIKRQDTKVGDWWYVCFIVPLDERKNFVEACESFLAKALQKAQISLHRKRISVRPAPVLPPQSPSAA